MNTWSPYAPDHPGLTLTPDDLEFVYQDEHLYAINKPAGLLVHRGWGRDERTLVSLLKPLMPQGVFALHRIDRATSGLVLFAKHSEAARALNLTMQSGLIRKRYLMLTRGYAPDSGWIDHPINRREDGPPVPSFTAFRTLHKAQTTPRVTSLIEASPLTGRPHQLRRHMSFINHPLIADSDYGKASLNAAFRAQYNLYRLALHAASLSFTHPFTQQRITLTAPIAHDLHMAWTHMDIAPHIWQDAIAQDDSWVHQLIPPSIDADLHLTSGEDDEDDRLDA